MRIWTRSFVLYVVLNRYSFEVFSSEGAAGFRREKCAEYERTLIGRKRCNSIVQASGGLFLVHGVEDAVAKDPEIATVGFQECGESARCRSISVCSVALQVSFAQSGAIQWGCHEA